MNISILGTGNMAHAIAMRLLVGGNSVTLFTRDLNKADELHRELDGIARGGGKVDVEKLGSPISDPVVINTIWYNIARDVVASYSDQLKGKVLVDVTNPLNDTHDDLAVPPGTSAAEELAKLAPGARVVKAFNTTFAGLLSEGEVGGDPLDVFIAGDDADAKETVTQLLKAGSLRVFDVGPLKRARQLEGMGLLENVLQSKVENPWMNTLKIIS